MKNPRALAGAGVTGAGTSSLGGEQFEHLSHAGASLNQNRKRYAAAIDRAADFYLTCGQHLIAERLAWRAEALRAGGAR